jgi:leukotriene-A4 hydrolase
LTLNQQPVGIPSYLIAIASGNLRYRSFPAIEGKGWKSGVWAEPELLDACYWEFSEDTGRSPIWSHSARYTIDALPVNRFLAKEEDVVGPYKFGVYDVLVLPPSFPYGGMVSRLKPPLPQDSDLATFVDGLRRKMLVFPS